MEKAEIWVGELLKNLDRFTDSETQKAILENCGIKCPFSHMPDENLLKLRKNFPKENEFLEKLSEEWRLRKEDGRVFIVFDRCYCPLVLKNPENFSKTMCYCTLGSLKHKFKISLGRDVEVKILKTVLSGDNECRFELMI